MARATGQITITDLNDAKTLTITASSTVFSYDPDNVVSPSSIVLTATGVNTESSVYVWSYYNGSAWVTISGSTNTITIPSSATYFTDSTLLIKATIAFDGVSNQITLSKVHDGFPPVDIDIETNLGTIFKNALDTEYLTAKLNMVQKGVVVTGTPYQWYYRDASQLTDIGGGVGWKVCANATNSYAGATTSTLTVYAINVPGVQSFKGKVTYKGVVYYSSVTFLDQTDNLQVIIESSNGDFFKNGIVSSTLTARIYQNGGIITSGYTYAWTRVDKDGNSVAWSKTTASCTISISDVDERSTFWVEIKEGTNVRARNFKTITDVNDITISDTPPSNPIMDQQWFDSSDRTLKSWNGSFWISVNNFGSLGEVTGSGISFTGSQNSVATITKIEGNTDYEVSVGSTNLYDLDLFMTTPDGYTCVPVDHILEHGKVYNCSANTAVWMKLTDAHSSGSSCFEIQSTTGTFTYNSAYKYLYIGINTGVIPTRATLATYSIMLNEGSSALAYVPFIPTRPSVKYPSIIKSSFDTITGNYLGTTGYQKNLLPDSKINMTSGVYGFGERTLTTILKKNTTYTVTVNGNKGTSNGNLMIHMVIGSYHWAMSTFIDSLTNSTIQYTFTLPDTHNVLWDRIVLLYYNYPGGSTGVVTVNWVTLVEGSTAPLTWFPSVWDATTDATVLKLPYPVTAPLRSVGTVRDSIEGNILTRRVGALSKPSVVEYFSMYSDSKYACYAWRMGNLTTIKDNWQSGKCNYFNAVDSIWNYSKSGFTIQNSVGNNTGYIWFKVLKQLTPNNTSAEFVSLLGSDFKILYELPTPTTEYISNIQIPTFDPKTEVFSNNVIEPYYTLDFKPKGWAELNNQIISERSKIDTVISDLTTTKGSLVQSQDILKTIQTDIGGVHTQINQWVADYAKVGGYNRIPNSTGRNGIVGWTGVVLATPPQFDTQSGSHFTTNGTSFVSPSFLITVSTNYTYSLKIKAPVTNASVKWNISIQVVTALGTTTYPLITNIAVDSTQVMNYSKSFTLSPGSKILSAYIVGSCTGGTASIYLADMILNEGVTQLYWSQAENEVFGGNVKIDADGVMVGQYDPTNPPAEGTMRSFTVMDADEFSVYYSDTSLVKKPEHKVLTFAQELSILKKTKVMDSLEIGDNSGSGQSTRLVPRINGLDIVIID